MAGYLVPTSRLRGAILELLEQGARTTDELCSHFGYSASAVRYRLHDLEDAGRIHHVKHVYTTGGGSYFTWHAGKRTKITPPRPAQRASKATRDPLVAALFGAPGRAVQETAR